MAGAATKLTTGLTGLQVAKHPQHSLKILYEKILNTLQKMPAEAAYRKNTQQIVEDRLAIVKSAKDVTSIETKINCGQAEELIVQAENELSLSRQMLKWKPWEPLISESPKNQWKWPMV
ncbi:NADH dehydrogenase [ubiquinone] 1 alpha subcomplex subunit 5-like [Liolophura sinensis]|uniref:NADH dehydrogenase [ubiquinone] 1 alpha subcomplex subunit 5-like n=1 Tax=Liolophura sinensis TaxID=3198878 RepID=UPI0031586357